MRRTTILAGALALCVCFAVPDGVIAQRRSLAATPRHHWQRYELEPGITIEAPGPLQRQDPESINSELRRIAPDRARDVRLASMYTCVVGELAIVAGKYEPLGTTVLDPAAALTGGFERIGSRPGVSDMTYSISNQGNEGASIRGSFKGAGRTYRAAGVAVRDGDSLWSVMTIDPAPGREAEATARRIFDSLSLRIPSDGDIISGTWRGSIRSAFGPAPLELDLRRTRETLSGSITVDGRVYPVLSGTFEDAEVTIVYRADGAVHTFRGVIVEDRLAGPCDVKPDAPRRDTKYIPSYWELTRSGSAPR